VSKEFLDPTQNLYEVRTAAA